MKTRCDSVISHDLLKSWSPCADGYKRYCELFPDGTDLKTAADGLSADGHDEWAVWLFDKCREENVFNEVTAKGHGNSGERNSGDWNSGDRNSGDWNSGDRNSGERNSGDGNSGCFNTTTPATILVFNKAVSRQVWNNAYKPDFLFFQTTYWVDESVMTDAEKAADPNFGVCGGQLRKKDYKQAFKESWDAADKTDRERVRELPNFDAQIFHEISGIDLQHQANEGAISENR